METRTVLAGSAILLCIGLYPLLAVVFGWPLAWRSIRTGRETHPMSVAGKLACTALPFVIVFCAAAVTSKLPQVCYAIGIPLTIFVAAAIAHDMHR